MLCLGAGRWQDANKSTYGAVREILEAHTPEARKTKLDTVWAIFIEWHSDDVLLSHPNYRPYEGESKLVYKPPIMDISTAAYDDVELIMERIEEELIEEKGMNAVLCVGDQQTFSRMWHLKLADPEKYFWVIPCSGDFHYQFHVASGLHRVAYAPLLQWFVNSRFVSARDPRRESPRRESPRPEARGPRRESPRSEVRGPRLRRERPVTAQGLCHTRSGQQILPGIHLVLVMMTH